MMKQTYEDYKYVMQDTGTISFGAKYSYRELILLAGQVAMDSDDMIMSSAAEKGEVRKLQELLSE